MSRILLVEDNEFNRDMLSRRLTRAGYEVLCAEDGPQGVQMAREATPDLVLMDVALGTMDGWEATQLIVTGTTAPPRMRCSSERDSRSDSIKGR